MLVCALKLWKNIILNRKCSYIRLHYESYHIAILETEDFFTACLPELMDNLSPAVFPLLLGKINLEDAIAYVKCKILNEDE